MNVLRMFFLLALGMWMTVCVTGCVTASKPSGEPASGARGSERQILVMLHLPPAHFRPDESYGAGYVDDVSRHARRRIAADLARTHGLKLLSDWPMPVLSVHCFVMERQENGPSEQIAEVISRDPRVEWAQPMRFFHARNDPLYPLQPGASVWHLTDIHRIATGRNVNVAVVDSGIEADHPDLAGQIGFQENFVDGNPKVSEAHGTAVAGIIAARAGNGVGIEGMAPGARLLALRACWDAPGDVTECNSFTLGKALNSAVAHRAQIINLSVTGPPDRLLQRLLDAALARGTKIIAAADLHAPGIGFPASYPGVFAVADEAATVAGVAGANGIGPSAGLLAAPGRDIPTTMPHARWGFVSGSSFAAAHVSGLIALLTELKPELEPFQMRQQLVVNPNGTQPDQTIDACATMARTAGQRSCSCSCSTAHAATGNQHP